MHAEKSWLVGERQVVEAVASQIGLNVANDENVYLTDKPSEDPTETCWLINQYDFDQPLQYICTADTTLDDHNDAVHNEDSW